MLDDYRDIPHACAVIIHLAAALLLANIASAELIQTPRLTCEVTETAATSTLTAKIKGSDEPVVFRIEWKNALEKIENFKITPAKDGAITSTYRLGKTTVTRTILASMKADCIFIHVIADQPGAVSFQASFVTKFPTEIQNRREIILSGGKSQAHAWIIPYESDVRDDAKGTVFLNGEGESLIILNLTANPATSPISNTLIRLGKTYDPTHTPPSPQLIWEAVEERLNESSEEAKKG